MGLLNDLANQGLISNTESKLANSLAEAGQRITTAQSTIVNKGQEYTDPYLQSLNQQFGYLQQQIDKQNKLNAESGLLSYSNLTSGNPLVSVPTNLLNFGAQVTGAVVDQFTNAAGGINIANANSMYASIPDDIKDIYNRERLDASRNENRAALTGIQNALAKGQVSDLIGYDKKFKTRTELDNHIADLQSKVNSKPVSEEERLRLDGADGRVMATNSLLTPLRQSYRDVFNQIEQNYKDDRMWRGNRAKDEDNFFGSRSWGNKFGNEQFSEDFAQMDKANAELNKQGQFQRANSEFGSKEYWQGVGKSWDAFKGSVGTAVTAVQDNPRAIGDMLAETLPFLIGRTANTAFSGDALRVYADAGQDITQREKVAAPSLLQDATAVAGAAAYTGLNLVERQTLLGAVKGKVPGANTVDDIASGVASASSRITDKVVNALPLAVTNTARTVNRFLPTRTLANITKNAALSGAMEGAVEMGQQQIEDSWSKSKTDVDTSALAQSGVLGAALGAMMSAPGSVVETVQNKLNANANAAVENTVGNLQTQQNEDLLNVANPDYAPAKVVNRILATELPNQNYEGAKQQIDEIIATTNQQLSSIQEDITAAQNPDVLAKRIETGKGILEKFQSENTPDTNPNYDAIVENYNNRIGNLQATYDRVTDPEYNIEEQQAALTKLQEGLTSMEEPYNRLVAAQAKLNETQNNSAPENEQPADEATRHLGAPSSANLQRMRLLSEDPNVPENVRNNLRVVADALLADNKTKSPEKVLKQATQGDQGFRGTEQYLTEMANAVKAGDTGRQESLTNQLNYFKQSRESKLAALQEAQQLADSTGKRIQVVKPNNGQWQVVQGEALPNTQFQKNNGLLVNPHRQNGTGGIDTVMNAISEELNAINATADAFNVLRNNTPDTFNGQVNDLRNDYMTDRNQSNPDPMQQAMDDFNQAQREAKSWNENARSELNFEDNANADINGPDQGNAVEQPVSTTTEGDAELSAPESGDAIGIDEAGRATEEVSEITDQQPTDPSTTVESTKPRGKSDKQSSKPTAKPERFNYRSKFDTKKEAQQYLEKHNKQDAYYVLDTAGKGYTIKKHPDAKTTPRTQSDVSTVMAAEQNVPAAAVSEDAYNTPTVSESATEANQTQELTADPVVEYEANTEQEPVAATSPDGAINPISTNGLTNEEFVAQERAKDKRKQNLISSGFIQRIKDGFNSPLVTIPNYVSSIKDRSRKELTETIIQFTGQEPSEAQLILANDFMQFNKAKGINKAIREVIKANANPEYNYLSYSDFLLDSDGKLDENTATAITLSMYSWVGENARSLYNDKSAIGKILRLKNADNIPYAVTERLANVGTHQKTLASTLGQKAYQALQLKMLKDVDPVRQSKVEQMLGTIAIGMMVDLGLAERTRITNGELYQMAEYTKGNDISTLDPKLAQDPAYTYFIRPAAKIDANGKLEPTNFNKRIQDLHKDTRGVLSALFGFEPYTTLPSLEPVKSLPQTFNEFNGKLPKMVKNALLKQQTLEYRLNVPMVELTNRLLETPKGQEAVAKILGYEDPMNHHIAFEKTINSVNQGIERSIDLLQQTYSLVGDQGFYLPSTVWSNFRNGNPAGFNPQGDKIHRGYVSLANDRITVTVDEGRSLFDEKGELTQYGMFLRGLAFRMEDVTINGNPVDKTEVEKFIPQFHDYINSVEVQAAADALNNLLESSYTDTDLNTVTDLLASWEMGALGLSALMAINTRNQAFKAGNTTFEVSMAADSDGLVNGPAITNLMLNSGNPTFNRSVGIIPFAQEGEEQITSMQQLRNMPNTRDPYEQLADVQKAIWDKLPRDNTPAGLATRAIDFLDSEYGKRKGAKRALTPFNYGSGMEKVNIANARGTLNAIYKKIEQAGRDYQTNPQKAADISKAVNVLIKYHNSRTNSKVEMTTPQSIADMSNLLTYQQENAITQTDIALRGETTSKALSSLMGDYIKLRNEKTAMANAAYEVFNAIYESEFEAAVELKTGSILGDSVAEKLTAEEKQKLLDDAYAYMPSLATPEGIKSNEVESSSIPMVDMGKKWNDEQSIEVKFNRSFGHKLTNLSSNTNQAKSKNGTTYLKTDIREKVFQTPGVSSLALYIQSHDAFVTYSVMQAMQAQNFHDANSTNAYDLVKMAKIQNKAFLDVLTISHIGKAYSDGLTKVVNKLVTDFDNLAIDKRITSLVALTNMLEAHNAVNTSFGTGLAEIYANYYASDIAKLDNLVQQHSISQYATEGGSYVLTDADRATIATRREQLVLEQAAAIKKITELGTKLDSRVLKGIDTKPKRTQTSLTDTLAANKEQFKDPQKLITHLQKDLARYLNQESNAGKYATMFNELLNISKAVLPANLEVNIIDGTTDTSKVLGYQDALANGYSAWFSSDNKSNQINLRLDKDRLDTKTLVHEFIHAATSNAIDAARKEPGKYPEAKQAIDKLERLMDHVKSKVTPKHDPVIQYGMKNLDEFIATGLTYPKFIEFLDSITDVPVETRGKERSGTAFRTFVSRILDVLYRVGGKGRSYNVKTLSAYEALLLDTSELISQDRSLVDPSVKTLGAPRQKATNQVSEYTAREVFDSLDDGTLNSEFKKQLSDTVTSITDRLFSALPHKFARGNADYSPDQIWNQALNNGRAPYITAAIKAGFKLSAQEQFAVEALEVALREATKQGSVSLAYKTIADGFVKARDTLQVKDFHQGDWNAASAAEQAIAKQKYDHIFKVGKEDYITRFTALALGSQEFNSMLTQKLERNLFATRGQPVFDKLINMANHFMNITNDRLTKTIGSTTIQGKLPVLAQHLIEIDLKNRNKSTNLIESTYLKADDLANDGVNAVKKKLSEAFLGTPLSNTGNKYINIVSNTLKATKDGRSVISVMDEVRNFRNHNNPNKRLGFLGELANEIGDQNSAQLLAEKMLAYAKHNEGEAHRIRTVVRQDVLSHFADNGSKLTRQDRANITTAFLRTDAQSLLSSYGYEKLGEFISDRTKLNNEIAALEKKVKDPVRISRTKSLAWYMVSGVGTETLAKNPTLIAQNAGLGLGLFTATDEQIKTIDDLASLYAIKYTDNSTLKAAHKIMQDEYTRPDKGGVYALVKYHEALARDSYNELFGSNIVSYTKGYLPNIMNPHKEVNVVTSKADIARLREAMYTEIGTTGKSVIDPDGNEALMFYSEDAGNQRYVSGAMALYNYGRKGTEIDMNPKEFVDAQSRAISTLNVDPAFDPRKEIGSRAIPTYDNDGRVIAYNYEMSGHVRDTYLERNNDFAEIMGEFTSAGVNKINLKDQNLAVADALIEQFKTGYKKDPNGYIFVGAGVTDSTLSQSWAMIPKEIRTHIYNRTGMNGIYVHNQAYLTIFGTKKYSLTSAFDKTKEAQNIAEQLFTGFMRAIFKGNARVTTAKTERMWQEAVGLLKDIVVIRNMSTALINLVSNSLLLLTHGVSPVDIVKHSLEAVKAGAEYRKYSAELIKLQNRQRIEVGNAEAIQNSINMLEQRLARNPLKSFIDAGMFAGIVEDIDTDNQSYTYASGLQRKYEGVIDKIPGTVKQTARFAFVQPGTPLYQFLHSATQYGDFSAKYVMYKHYTEKAKKRLTHDQAITMASNNFINYDVPTSKGMQYANDMGLLMFTKYNLRIQRALFDVLARRPASAIGQALIINAMSNLPPGIDPLFLNQIGNPLRNGPLGLLGALDEPFPIQMLLK